MISVAKLNHIYIGGFLIDMNCQSSVSMQEVLFLSCSEEESNGVNTCLQLRFATFNHNLNCNLTF